MFTAKIITRNKQGQAIYLTELHFHSVPRVGEGILVNCSLYDSSVTSISGKAMIMEVTRVLHSVKNGDYPEQEISLIVKILEGGQDYL